MALDMFGQANGFYDYASQLDGQKSPDKLALEEMKENFLIFNL